MTVAFTNDELREHKLSLVFVFERSCFENFFWAIEKIEKTDLDPALVSNLEKEFVAAFGRFEGSEMWPVGDWFPQPYFNWGPKAFEDVLFSEPAQGELELDLFGKLVTMKRVAEKALRKPEA
jgi:hypothetical protein